MGMGGGVSGPQPPFYLCWSYSFWYTSLFSSCTNFKDQCDRNSSLTQEDKPVHLQCFLSTDILGFVVNIEGEDEGVSTKCISLDRDLLLSTVIQDFFVVVESLRLLSTLLYHTYDNQFFTTHLKKELYIYEPTRIFAHLYFHKVGLLFRGPGGQSHFWTLIISSK